MKRVIYIILFLVLFPMCIVNAQGSNVGFVPGNIWYSIDPFNEGDEVQIYTFIFNPDERELSGSVLFFDNSTLLGRKEFKVPGKQAEEVFTTWKATFGDHEIFAKIDNAKFLESDGTFQEVFITENETQRSERKVSKSFIEKLADPENQDNILAKAESLGETILDKTPETIKTPLVSSTDKIEDWRNQGALNTQSRKDKTESTINTIEENEKSDNSSNKDTLLKPFKYVELFFLNLIYFILSHPIVFYGTIVLVVFGFIRFIFARFF